MKTTVKKFKYKVGDKVKFEEFDVIIKGMNYYSPSNISTYLVKGYPLGHNGGITSYHYNELGFKIQHVGGIDYYYVDENELTPISTVSEKFITYTPGTISSSKNYYLGQKIKAKIGSKEYIGTIEGFDKYWRENNGPLYLSIRFYGMDDKGHNGLFGSVYNYDENGKSINFNSKSSKGYWFISLDQILETYPSEWKDIPKIIDDFIIKSDTLFNSETISDVSIIKIPKIWMEVKNKISHQSAIVIKSPVKKPNSILLKNEIRKKYYCYSTIQ